MKESPSVQLPEGWKWVWHEAYTYNVNGKVIKVEGWWQKMPPHNKKVKGVV